MARGGPSIEMLNRLTGIGCRTVQELSLLFVVSQTLERSFDLTDIVRPVLHRLKDLMGMECGTITLLNRDNNTLVLSEAVGLPRTVSPQNYLAIIKPHLKESIAKKEPVVVPEFVDWIQAREEYASVIKQLPIAFGASFICVPLKFEDEVIGTLSIESLCPEGASWESDMRILGMIAAIIAQAARLRQDAAEQIQSLREENDRLQQEIAHQFRPSNMIGTASSMRTVYYHIDQVARSMTSVLIRGESGTGKEIVAKALHEKSVRAKKPFVKFNCAALPESIIESELFGHEKGAFTGALAMRQGRFEVADGGTIFLDEIGDISPTTQVKLLRVLQEREFERVGSQEPRKVDVRIIAATSRNLEEMMEQGKFREDLFYRLNVFPICVPPLRERKCDILLLADHFIEQNASRLGVKPMRISSAAIDLLMSYHWPGNVRELENCIERSVLLAHGQSIKAHHLPPTLQKKDSIERSDTATLADAVDALEREMIVDALKETGSNIAEAARRLGITERKMGLRIRKHEIDVNRFKS